MCNVYWVRLSVFCRSSSLHPNVTRLISDFLVCLYAEVKAIDNDINHVRFEQERPRNLSWEQHTQRLLRWLSPVR